MKKYFLILLGFLQCDSEIRYPIPDQILPQTPKTNTSLHAVWERVNQSETGFIRFTEDEEELWASCFVVSSDAAGNFYKELYVQDAPENPSRGARLLLDQTALHSFVPFGSKVFIKLNGLGAGMERGVLSIGNFQADGVAPIPQPLVKDHIIRSGEKSNITPLEVQIKSLTEHTLGIWVTIGPVQFSKSELGKTFSAEAFDSFDGERWVFSCHDYRGLIVSSSVYASFTSVLVDSMAGILKGIHTRDYYNEKDILKLNSLDNIAFSQLRCDPLFEENFETQLLGQFQVPQWINWIEKGSQYWEVYEDENSLGQSLRIGSYRSRDAKTITWLISPLFTPNTQEELYFSFRSSTAFADNSELEFFSSTDFDGNYLNIKKATWKKVNAVIASEDQSDILWVDSGAIPLGNTPVYFAFRYTGSGKTAQDGTFELDDFRVYKPTFE